MAWQPPNLTDLRRRTLRYIRISVTDRCQFRCPYCRPEAGEAPCEPSADYLTPAEIARLAKLLRAVGINTIRFTGGEPLLRRDLAEIIAAVVAVGFEDIALSTNAALLHAGRAKALADAGLKRLNISLDTIDADRFRTLSGGAELAPVLAGIDCARAAGMALKTNTVVMRDHNDDELLEIARFAWSIGAVPRFIEVMPIGAGADQKMVPAAEIMSAFSLSPERPDAALRGGIGPADYWVHEGRADQVIGVIAATTRNFCAACNRIRLTATGEIRPCLASVSGVALRPMLRDGQSDDATILAAIQAALDLKPEGHRFHEGVRGEAPMRSIGG
jgi:cyclic pyranopterin phosphate synthase